MSEEGIIVLSEEEEDSLRKIVNSKSSWLYSTMFGKRIKIVVNDETIMDGVIDVDRGNTKKLYKYFIFYDGTKVGEIISANEDSKEVANEWLEKVPFLISAAVRRTLKQDPNLLMVKKQGEYNDTEIENR